MNNHYILILEDLGILIRLSTVCLRSPMHWSDQVSQVSETSVSAVLHGAQDCEEWKRLVRQGIWSEGHNSQNEAKKKKKEDIHQLFGIHVVQYPLGIILRVSPGLHDGQQQLGCVVLQLEDQVHAGPTKRIDVVEDERRDDVKPVALMHGDAVLVLMARSWKRVFISYMIQEIFDQNQSP